MTTNELVKNVLSGNTCELYDRVRIENLFTNLKKGYGKLLIFQDSISITHTNKSKKIVYNILKILLTENQKDYSLLSQK